MKIPTRFRPSNIERLAQLCEGSSAAVQFARQMEAQRRHYDTVYGQTAATMEAMRRRYDSLIGQTTAAMEAQRRHYDTVYGRTAATMEAMRRRYDSLIGQTTAAMEAVHRHNALVIEGNRTVMEVLWDKQDSAIALKLISQMEQQSRVLNGLARERSAGVAPSSAIVRANEAWTVGVTSVLGRAAEVGLWEKHPILGARLTALPNAYTSFCSSTSRELAHAANEHTVRALEGALRLAGQHFIEATDTISLLVAVPVQRDISTPPSPMRLYVVQKDELVAAPEITNPEDLDELTGRSEAAGSAAEVLRMLKLLPQANMTSRLSGRRTYSSQPPE
jgi:hypothetical protein